jgi:hypothetical protein
VSAASSEQRSLSSEIVAKAKEMHIAGKCRVFLQALALAACALPAIAQETIGDWSVFVEKAGVNKKCWTVTASSDKAYLLFVSKSPGRKLEVAVSGEPRLPVSKGMKLIVGSHSYQFFSEGRYAWPDKPKDREIIEMIGLAESSGGKERVTFILSGAGEAFFSSRGFKASLKSAEALCR